MLCYIVGLSLHLNSKKDQKNQRVEPLLSVRGDILHDYHLYAEISAGLPSARNH